MQTLQKPIATGTIINT